MQIKQLCYELYKIDWKKQYQVNEVSYIKDYYKGLVDNFSVYTYNDYLNEFGYNGEYYASYEEFLTAEYYNLDYITSLLNDDELIKLYIADINTA